MKQHVHGRKTRPTYLLSCRARRLSKATFECDERRKLLARIYTRLAFTLIFDDFFSYSLLMLRNFFFFFFVELNRWLFSRFNLTAETKFLLILIVASLTHLFLRVYTFHLSISAIPPQFPFGIHSPSRFFYPCAVAHLYIVVSPLILAYFLLFPFV